LPTSAPHHCAASRRGDRRRHPRSSPAGCRGAERLSWRACLMLAIEGLNAHYGASHVLQGVDIEVPGGTIVSVLGRNGVGKTTTVRAIMGLVPPSSGRVLLDGQDIAGWPPHRVARAGVAYVPEGRLIFPDGVTILLIEQNLKLAAEVADRLAVMVKGRIVYSASPTTFSAEEESVRSRYLMV